MTHGKNVVDTIYSELIKMDNFFSKASQYIIQNSESLNSFEDYLVKTELNRKLYNVHCSFGNTVDG